MRWHWSLRYLVSSVLGEGLLWLPFAYQAGIPSCRLHLLLFGVRWGGAPRRQRGREHRVRVSCYWSYSVHESLTKQKVKEGLKVQNVDSHGFVCHKVHETPSYTRTTPLRRYLFDTTFFNVTRRLVRRVRSRSVPLFSLSVKKDFCVV